MFIDDLATFRLLMNQMPVKRYTDRFHVRYYRLNLGKKDVKPAAGK
jgi:hypothetical protein